MNHLLSKPITKELLKLMAGLSIVALLFLVASPLHGQPANLTPEQIEQLRSLNAQQQQQSNNVQNQLLEDATSPVPREANVTVQQDAIERNAQQTQGLDQLDEEVEQQVTSEPLRQFGYELFAGVPSTFAPSTNIPVPLNYVVGPNDTVIVQLYGQINARYEIVVTREGVLQFPEIGPLNVAGLSFGEMRELIETTVSTSLIGQQISVTMGALRSIQIFILGEAFRPGSYTVSSLSTMTNALFSSGGVTRVGSLRDIRLMRQGELITSLDLYDLLLRGDTSGDVRLQPNDVIFIPPIGLTVGIAGEIRRPAIFEIKDEEVIEDVLPLAGGFLSTAYPAVSRMERINSQGERTLVDVDLSVDATLQLPIRDGDVLQIYSVLDQIEGVVQLQGHINRPGGFQWREGLRVTDILPNVTAMLPNPDLEYALISREVQPERTLEVINVNLREAFLNPGSDADLALEPRDQLLVFGARSSRQAQVQTLVETLRSQATFDQLPLVVSIEGNVLFAGEYPLIRNMTLDDLVRFSGGLGLNTELDYVLVERQIDLQGEIDVFATKFDELTLSTVENIPLMPADKILIFNANTSRQELLADTLQKLRGQADTDNPTQIVSIIGNVRYPGTYPLQRDLTVEDLIDVSGGLLESAETRLAEITRYDAEPAVGREVGHTSVNLLNEGRSGRNLALQPFDQLIIRQMPNWTVVETVTLQGEVNSPGTYVITQNETIANLIERAGGLTEFADPKAAVFLRESLRETEARLLAEYRSQLETDIITLRLQQSVVTQNEDSRVQGQGQSEAIQLLDRIQNLEPVGRLVMDLPAMLAGTAQAVILRDGDRLLIPREQQEITITGEVFRPTSHLYEPGSTFGDYIAKSGGLRDDADESNIYVVRRSGELEQVSRNYWFFQGREAVEPGDTIVVPFDAYKPYGFFIWSEIAQIAASLSTTLLLVDRISND